MNSKTFLIHVMKPTSEDEEYSGFEATVNVPRYSIWQHNKYLGTMALRESINLEEQRPTMWMSLTTGRCG